MQTRKLIHFHPQIVLLYPSLRLFLKCDFEKNRKGGDVINKLAILRDTRDFPY